MQFVFPWFTLIYLFGSVLTLVLAIVIWKRQFAPGVLPFTILLFAMSFWTLCSALEVGAVGIPSKTLFAKGEYLSLVSCGALSLTFILEYTHSAWIKRPRHLVLIWILPVLSLALVWTNELHGLVWSNIFLNPDSAGTLAVWEHGALYWLVPLYQYLLYLLGFITLWRFGIRQPRPYRRQVYCLLAGSLIPVAGSLVYISGGIPIQGFDITPLSICLMGVVYAVTIFHFRLMVTLPTATAVLIKNLHDGFLLLDFSGRILSVNPATERIIGHTQSELSGRRLAEIWPELDGFLHDNPALSHFELWFKKDNRNSCLDINAESFYDSRGVLTGRLAIIRDITELKSARLELEAEINLRSQFMRTIVHELRNPLTAILSSNNELLENPRMDEKIRLALINNVNRASMDLARRVNELLDLSRGDLGILEINPESLDMNRLIPEVGAEMQPVAAQKGLALTWQLCPEPALIQGDPQRMRQVLFNLIDNAIKYSRQGQISICTQLARDELLVRVTDTGRGIHKEELDYLFNLYRHNREDHNSSGGLGIGLSLCKKYIELHRGRIWAESIPGKGTTISFTIPFSLSGGDGG